MYVQYGTSNLSDLAGYPVGSKATSTVRTWTQQRTRNQRGNPDAMRRTMVIAGELLAYSQADIDTMIAALRTALGTEGADAGLYTDADALTEHALDHSDSSSGVRIISGPDFTDSSPQEFATGRKWTATLEAIYDDPADENLLFEAIRIQQSGGGARYAIDDLVAGTPAVYQVAAVTRGTRTYSGTRVGKDSYPTAPDPSTVANGGTYISEASSVGNQLPQLLQSRLTNYTTFWNYTFWKAGAFS